MKISLKWIIYAVPSDYAVQMIMKKMTFRRSLASATGWERKERENVEVLG